MPIAPPTPDAGLTVTDVAAPSSTIKGQPAPRRRRKVSQERVMLMFVFFFALGIALLVFIPEGSPFRGAAMAIYSVAVFWSMFRFGI
jgi:hypothetical protein